MISADWTDYATAANRRKALLTLALAFEVCGIVPSELRPEAFPGERDRKLWRGVIETWGKRQRGEAA